MKVPTLDYLLFALRYAARFDGRTDFDPKKVPGWEKVKKAAKIRDRVVHAKVVDDLNVTVEEHLVCKGAAIWLLGCLRMLEGLEGSNRTFEEGLQILSTFMPSV
jgi:hypothetical protein